MMFSVVIPTYNRAAMVVRAIESVRAQTFTDYEIIVVDDGSTDDTATRVESMGVRCLRQPNAGPAAARNRGIAEAAGQYVAFLDSDDTWFPWTLATYAQAIAERNCAFITARPKDVSVFATTASPTEIELDAGVGTTTIEYDSDFFASRHNPMLSFTTSSVAVSADALRAVGGFTGERMNYEDMDLWFRLGTTPGFAWIASPPCAVRYLHGQNIYTQRDLNVKGALHMIAAENAGQYPGGATRQGERRDRLAGMIRTASLGMLKSGNTADARKLYRATFGWHVRSGRLKYLLGFPLLAMRAGKGGQH